MINSNFMKHTTPVISEAVVRLASIGARVAVKYRGCGDEKMEKIP